MSVPLRASTAQHRMLVHLNRDGLQDPSAGAHEHGRRLLLRAGVVGLAKQVDVQVLPAYQQQETFVIPLRWVATGPTGRLFPELDANLEISASGPEECCVRMVGSYRPPMGGVGAGLDRVVLHRVGEATFRTMLHRLCATLLDPPPPDEIDVPSSDARWN